MPTVMLRPDGVIWHCTTSLDGYVADSDDKVDFSFRYGSHANPLVSEILAGLGAILIGRRTYDVATSKPGGRAYGGKLHVPEFVVSLRPPPVASGSIPTFLSGTNLGAAVTTAKEAANGKMVAILGPTLAAAILKAGLLDQIVLHIVPIFLGGGTRLMSQEQPAPCPLRKIAAFENADVTNLILEPCKIAAIAEV